MVGIIPCILFLETMPMWLLDHLCLCTPVQIYLQVPSRSSERAIPILSLGYGMPDSPNLDWVLRAKEEFEVNLCKMTSCSVQSHLPVAGASLGLWMVLANILATWRVLRWINCSASVLPSWTTHSSVVLINSPF